MKIFYTLIITLFLYNFAASQVLQSSKVNAIQFYQQFILSELDLVGYSPSTLSTVTHIINANPALLSSIKNSSIGLSYQFESKIDRLTSISASHQRTRLYLPQSALYVYPFKNLSLGIGFSQKVNSIIEFPKIDVTSIENPEGTGEYIRISKETNIFNYSALISSDYLTINDLNINFGFQLDLNHLIYIAKIWRDEVYSNAYNVSWKTGVSFNWSLFDCGLFYKKGSNLKNSSKYKGAGLLVYIDEQGNQQNPVTPSYKVYAKTPDVFNVGISILPAKMLRFSFELSNVFWNKLQSEYNDANNYSFNINYKLTNYLNFTMGYLFNESYFKDEKFNGVNMYNKLKAEYLIIGSDFNIGDYSIGILLAESQFSSGTWRDQTISKLVFSKKL